MLAVLDEHQVTRPGRLQAGDAGNFSMAVAHQRRAQKLRNVLKCSFHCFLYNRLRGAKKS